LDKIGFRNDAREGVNHAIPNTRRHSTATSIQETNYKISAISKIWPR
jgi:hypothetical protein